MNDENNINNRSINIELNYKGDSLNESEDDIIISSENIEKTRLRKPNSKAKTFEILFYLIFRIEDLSLEEITAVINSFEPVPIKDWPRRPYKAMFIVF